MPGKFVDESENSYEQLKGITDPVYAALERGEPQPKFKAQAHALLDSYRVRLRQDDGRHFQTNISVPNDTTIVLGIRYVKASGRYTEDHFLFRRGMKLYKCKGKELAKILGEYAGAHEYQL